VESHLLRLFQRLEVLLEQSAEVQCQAAAVAPIPRVSCLLRGEHWRQRPLLRLLEAETRYGADIPGGPTPYVDHWRRRRQGEPLGV